MTTKRFYLHADGRRFLVRGNAISYIKSLPEDKAAEITIKCPWHPKRSVQANRYLWGVVYEAFMQHLPGWDAEDVHEYLLGEWSGWERHAVPRGWGSTREAVDVICRPMKRSSGLDKREFSDYVDFCIRKAADHGIFVPEPETAIPEYVK